MFATHTAPQSRLAAFVSGLLADVAPASQRVKRMAAVGAGVTAGTDFAWKVPPITCAFGALFVAMVILHVARLGRHVGQGIAWARD